MQEKRQMGIQRMNEKGVIRIRITNRKMLEVCIQIKIVSLLQVKKLLTNY